MSEPRHIYAWTEWHGVPLVVAASERTNGDARRYTLTDGDEYRALIERAREALETPNYKNAVLKSEALNALLAYLGETP